jgi:hypothetical protein
MFNGQVLRVTSIEAMPVVFSTATSDICYDYCLVSRRCSVAATDSSKESPPDENAKFGDALGAEFQPLGKRILITKGRDAKPLKMKRPQPRDESES